MKRDRTDKRFTKGPFHLLSLGALTFVLFLGLLSPQPAAAQCEPASDTAAPLNTLIADDVDTLNLLIQQEESFMGNLIDTALGMNIINEPPLNPNPQTNPGGVIEFELTFVKNVEKALNDWASFKWQPKIMLMTQELHVAQVDQTYRLGQLIDAQVMAQQQSRIANHINDAQRRYEPSELACEIDSTGPALAHVFQISRAMNRTFAMDDAPRHENSSQSNYAANSGTPSISAEGKGNEISSTWDEYVKYFCDPTMGDQGCSSPILPAPLAGKHKDIGALLWGPQQTIDPNDPNSVRIMESALRYVIDPLASDPIPPKAASTPAGHTDLLMRHAELAYVNTIYNVLGSMLSERIGGSGVDVQQMEAASGIPPQDTLPGGPEGASYRELQETMTRDRFNNPEYLVRLLGDPSQVMREQTTLNAIRLQTMNDIFRRSEERLFMESAEYGRDLNEQIPQSAAKVIPMK